MQTTTDPARLFGYDVLDSEGNKVGSIDNVWVDDATNELEFVGMKTGFFMGKIHVIPTADAQIADRAITVPYTESKIKDTPSVSGDDDVGPDQETEIYSYYGIDRSTSTSPTGLPPGGTTQDSRTDAGGGRPISDSAGEQDDQAGMTLSEEELQVGKQQVEAGRVRLRKVVRTEQQEVPVELRHEEVQVERVDASNASVPGDAFQEQTIEVPVMREEAVVGKEAHVTGGVRLSKNTTTETQTVDGEIRKESVEVDKDVDTKTTERRG